jgi:hypothetical protein
MVTTVETTTEQLPSGLKRLAATRPSDREGGRLIFRAAEKSVEFFDHLRAHYRETRRTAVEIPCDLRVVLLDGSTFDTGTGTVENVSPSGALITRLKISTGCFPAAAFKLMLVLKNDDYKGIVIEAAPVRFSLEPAGIGVRFEEIAVQV